MNRRSVEPATSASSTSTSGSTPASLASISVCRALTVSSINLIKKAGERPLSKTAPGPPGRKAVTLRLAPQQSIGERFESRAAAPLVAWRGRSRGAQPPGCWPARALPPPSAAGLLVGPGPGAIPVNTVVAAPRLQACGERQRLAGLIVAPQQLQAAAQAELGEVV